MRRLFRSFLLALLALPVAAQETPYFVTYDHRLEEPGNLEVAIIQTGGLPRHGQPGFAAWLLELEYGATGRWTTELYLEGQATRGDSTVFTGWRWENRFRPLKREHRINPILYLEYENINEASRVHKEIVGHAESEREPNAVLRGEKERALEGKLILSSQVRDWNISENFIVEKNFMEDEGVEFGYAFGVSRPLGRLASGSNCRWCRENFSAGVELYGGLGSTERFGFAQTAQYVAPVIAWRVGDDSAVKFSPAIGLNHNSARLLLRLAWSYEVEGFGPRLASLFRRRK